MTIDLQTIFGISLGFEMADNEVKEAVPGLRWGLAIDLLIFRISINSWEQE